MSKALDLNPELFNSSITDALEFIKNDIKLNWKDYGH
jgi:hypothetical protein